jgi:2-desacetyl-2-hydroxyethyl bacteriochlorophyllide A dehydrogenase
MQAAVLTELERIAVQTVATPAPGAGEVLVRVTLAGICGSDQAVFSGKIAVPLPVIPGHEMVGRVAALGKGVSRLTEGQRVTFQPNIGCGRCGLCRSGGGNLCPHKIRIGLDAPGVFAQYVVGPADHFWPVPPGMGDEVAVFAEPLAVAVRALGRAAPQGSQRVLIIGAGVIGLLTLQLCRLRGAEVSAMDIEPRRLARAAELGAAGTLDAARAPEGIGEGFDLIYETSGAPGALATATRLSAPRSRIVLLGLPKDEHPVASTVIVRKELHILGSLIYTDEFPQSLALLESGAIKTAPLISDRIGLEQLGAALAHFSAPGRIKTVIVIPGTAEGD